MSEHPPNHPAPGRVFLFLQGPHGPFFNRLGRSLRAAGAQTLRVGFNAGDSHFWSDRAGYIPFTDPPELWPAFFETLLGTRGVTDIVLYGDVRDLHAQAIRIAREHALTVHVFEEGYIRPYWATYERNGSNGHSRLMDFTVPQMGEALRLHPPDTTPPPSNWGDMRHHIFYGALYHGFLMLGTRRYRNFRPHRNVSVGREFRLYLQRMLMVPWHIVERTLATHRVRSSGFPYHLVLLQLEHDSSFQAHSSFSTMAEFIETVITGFAAGAPAHHQLVFKAHPLEDGRSPLRRTIRRIAREHGLTGRVHFIRGGKLARLLDEARSAVTVNSTSGQQVLWRGIPLRTFGSSIYNKPEFVSDQPLDEFFAHPHTPNRAAYVEFRRFLLETSQLPGGFYSTRGRRQLLRRVVDMMLRNEDPYDALMIQPEVGAAQQLRAIT